MKRATAERIAARFSFGTSGYSTWFLRVDCFPMNHYVPDGECGLRVSAAVRHRDTGEPNVLQIPVFIDSVLEDLRSAERFEEGMVERVYRSLRELVLHELDEAILVDGVRRFDPHLPKTELVDPPPPPA